MSRHAELLQVLTGCTACGDARPDGLYLRLSPDEALCHRCWRRAGCPCPPAAPPRYETEQEIRERMVERGGADRHRVRAGRT